MEKRFVGATTTSANSEKVRFVAATTTSAGADIEKDRFVEATTTSADSMKVRFVAATTTSADSEKDLFVAATTTNVFPAASTSPASPSKQPAGEEWRAATTAAGKTYFYNKRTRETRWTPPTDAPAAPAASATAAGGLNFAAATERLEAEKEALHAMLLRFESRQSTAATQLVMRDGYDDGATASSGRAKLTLKDIWPDADAASSTEGLKFANATLKAVRAEFNAAVLAIGDESRGHGAAVAEHKAGHVQHESEEEATHVRACAERQSALTLAASRDAKLLVLERTATQMRHEVASAVDLRDTVTDAIASAQAAHFAVVTRLGHSADAMRCKVAALAASWSSEHDVVEARGAEIAKELFAAQAAQKAALAAQKRAVTLLKAGVEHVVSPRRRAMAEARMTQSLGQHARAWENHAATLHHHHALREQQAHASHHATNTKRIRVQR